jgi:PleD family two-component response regulator
MNPIHVEATGESPSFGEQNVHAHSSASRGGTLTPPIQDRGGLPHRILVVDDDRDLRQLCADALICSDYRVDIAEDAVAGWQALHACNYSLLLTDNKMPMVSGIELIAKLRFPRRRLTGIRHSGSPPRC